MKFTRTRVEATASTETLDIFGVGKPDLDLALSMMTTPSTLTIEKGGGWKTLMQRTMPGVDGNDT